MLEDVLKNRQIGNYRFNFNVSDEELMISEETIQDEPPEVQGHLTIGKTYLLVDDTEEEYKDQIFISFPPTNVLSFNNSLFTKKVLEETFAASFAEYKGKWSPI